MSGVLRGMARLPAAGVVVVLAALLAVSYFSSKAAANDQCGVNGRAPCPNVACAGPCWSDGTVPSHGNKVKQTAFSTCGIGEDGCITQSCHP